MDGQDLDISARADEYLARPYARLVIPESDGTFRGEILEFPGCISTGRTAAEAMETLERVANGWLAAALHNHQTIPDPIEGNVEYSGRFVLRIPRSLHRKAAWAAQRDGASLNQFIIYSLAEAVGERGSAIDVKREASRVATPNALHSDAAKGVEPRTPRKPRAASQGR